MTARPRFNSDDLRLEESQAEQAVASEAARVRAVRVVAARSDGVEDCRELLGMLGLHTAAGLPGPATEGYVGPGPG
ncbi:hypothetical protein GCM10023201_47550 [Actinomycetospora corticicola]|uniref:Uncharacterized protein n=1 Tax=Actinomycetospora corticicola TaxID=663602 RepID=A0A7Y9J8L1_9PSEU|nr:hypothetical protein [Actinomycetospora corticicola]NYD39535.1 hypothetical protein [Actinomycetospora corticicola]